MRITCRALGIVFIGSLLVCGQTVAAPKEDGDYLVLKNNSKRTISLPKELQKEIDRERKELRKLYAAERRRINLEMKKNGFAILQDSEIQNMVNPVRHASNLQANPDTSVLSFQPQQLPSFTDATYLGGIADPEFPSLFSRVYEFEDWGFVIVEEYDFASDQRSGVYRTHKPKGDVAINGLPADYFAYMNENLDEGLTRIKFLNSKRMFTVSVTKSVPIDSPEHERLVQLLGDMY